MPTDLNPKHNDWYEELCALAAIGELSKSELDELEAHLAECDDCRQLRADFRRISAEDLGRVAIHRNRLEASEEVSLPMDEEALLGRLLQRAQQARPVAVASEPDPVDREVAASRRFRRMLDWLHRPALSYGTVGILLCALAAVAAYRLREAQLSPAIERLRSGQNEWQNRAEETARHQQETAKQLSRARSEVDTLQKSLEQARAKYAALQSAETSLAADLVAARAEVQRAKQEMTAATASSEQKTRQVAELETRVRNAMDRTEEQRRIAENLQAKLERAQEQAANTPEAQGFTDVEARQLFGARDLHIVDVYDVDTKGSTRRTFGRVYFVEKKLLAFYAFDLQLKHRNRAPVSFQAWGYRQPNEAKPESLGLFSMDDPALNRWVLKVNNPRVLEHIDAVFVTAEVPDGSPSPTGRHLLYANLAGPANHP